MEKKTYSIINDKFEEWILIATFVVVIALVSLQVLFRFTFNNSFGWSEEVARYLLIWIAWIGASYAVHKQAHFRIEVFKNLLPKAIQTVIEFIVLIIFFILALFLSVEGTKLLMKVHITGQVSPAANIPMWIVYLAIPIGGTLMCIRLIQQVLIVLRSLLSKKEA